VQMPGINGYQLLTSIKRLRADLPVVLMTAYGTVAQAVSAMREGATDYIVKPFDASALIEMARRQLAARVVTNELVAVDPESKRLVSLTRKIAETDATVLITGESGTGKELIAKAIHESSLRANRPFVTVNSSNIPSELLESELFGHTRGAFTGAFAAKKGYFEVADGGSIFLDEIGDIPPETQVRLLRVIQEREFTPLGDTSPRRVDVRIIAATNIDLKEAVRQGMFREDLYYRLAVVPIELPPLRDRRQDVLPLAQHFIRKYNEENGRHVSEHIAPEVLSLLENYSWPGNVRELENAVERAVVIAPGDEISRECLRPEIADPQAARAVVREGAGASASIDVGRGVNFYDEVRRFEIDLIRRALDQTGGHQSRAARLLGMNPTTLNSKIKTYNINLRP